jgi:unsaturated chondroitin disaccharide hydrolase
METTQLLSLVTHKLSVECDRIGTQIPYIPTQGTYSDMGKTDIAWWTNGFWPGILWQMYHATGESKYLVTARGIEQRLDAAMEQFLSVHHDVGFMWLPSAVADWRLTGDRHAYARGLHAATILAGRFNPMGKFIRAWNESPAGRVIIDSLMNINILYWATDVTKDPRFASIARLHADTLLRTHVRPDGSCAHIADLDPETGMVQEYPPCQGFSPSSAWSRGQSWAIYGYALSYRHTGEQRYLDAAKRIGRYFLTESEKSGNVPLVDFRAPATPVIYDTTAGSCAACGFLEIANACEDGKEADFWKEAAQATITSCCAAWANYDEKTDGILGGGTVAYHTKEYIHVPIIYGDYFLLEALLRLQQQEFTLW